MSLKLDLPAVMRTDAVRTLFAALEAKGGNGCVRFVGGCVRNIVMGRAPTDLDLATQLVPDDTEAALAAAGIRSVPTGKAFGTITAVIDGEPYEITSLREDVETDGRRAVVSYTEDWARDAQRRDFYLNALYADGEGRVSDPTGLGIDDARARRVRFIGDAEQRIREDYLRILRFFRFTAGYAAAIDEPSYAACIALKAGIDGLSGERVWQEISKTLGLPNPMTAFEAMQRGGVMRHVIPGWRLTAAALPELERMIRFSTDPERRFMALADAGAGLSGDGIKAVRSRLKLSRRLYDRLRTVEAVVSQLADADAAGMPRLIYLHGRQGVEDAVLLLAAHEGRDPHILLRLVEELHVPAFPIKGADLIRRGMTAGPEVGKRLKQIETEWLNHDFSQTVIDANLDDIGKRPAH
ncbi:MAG: CCA tRNA nucleotidyltransferase [Asticcacaulis sp.]